MITNSVRFQAAFHKLTSGLNCYFFCRQKQKKIRDDLREAGSVQIPGLPDAYVMQTVSTLSSWLDVYFVITQVLFVEERHLQAIYPHLAQ